MPPNWFPRAAAVAAAVLVYAQLVLGEDSLRFGVYPGNTFTFGKYVGLSGTNPQAPVGALAVARLVELAAGRPFDVHFYAQWDGGFQPPLAGDVATIRAAGLRANVALKYVPPSGHDGDLAGFAAWVSETVAAHPEVDVWQITNEANVPISPDTDGSFTDPVGALIAGVEAAAAVKTPEQQIGFNWFYRLDPLSDRSFWSALGTRGGESFRRALDFAGVDIYAGTYIPPLYSLNDEADFRTALEYVRREMMPLAGLGETVPINVQEFGYPTLAPIRSEAKQAEALAAYIRATGGLNVRLLQWFQLADANSPLGDGWGLVRADYTPKPAFDVMKAGQ
jgi:hypothetical protein